MSNRRHRKAATGRARRHTGFLASALSALTLVLILAGCASDAGTTDTGDGALFDVSSDVAADISSDHQAPDAATDGTIEDSAILPETMIADIDAADIGSDDGSDDGSDAGIALDALPPPPTILVAELMVDPCIAVEEDGEWIELRNASAGAVDLAGWILADDDLDYHVITVPRLLVERGGRVVLAANGESNQNGNFEPDYVYGADVRLSNLSDELELRDPYGRLVDRVTWGTGSVPVLECKALSLDPDVLSAEDNDRASTWCPAEGRYGWGDYGSPGGQNPDCPDSGDCGNGEQEPGEECDDGELNSDTEPDRCRLSCRLPRCGDGVIDTHETCDGGRLNSDTVPDRCRTSCEPAGCGDGVVDTDERCDGDCPDACDDQDPCTTDTLLGQADDCDARCDFVPATCGVADTCCPEGCSAAEDTDCTGR